MNTLVIVPQGGTASDVLAERYRIAFTKMEGGREQWIEGTLELAIVVAEAKIDRPSNRAFSDWLTHYQLGYLSPNDRVALAGFAEDLTAARKLLEESNSISWRVIWETRPKPALIKNDRSRNRRKVARLDREKSGAQKKKYIPTVMRDDYVSPPPPTKRLSDFTLTPEQVDPDFKGTPLEFTTKYGHVLLHTKDQIEQTKRQEALMAWLGTVADLDRMGRAMLAALANVDPATLAEWMSKPAKAEKLRTWCDSLQVVCEAISKLRPS